jgi:hypothetical protein
MSSEIPSSQLSSYSSQSAKLLKETLMSLKKTLDPEVMNQTLLRDALNEIDIVLEEMTNFSNNPRSSRPPRRMQQAIIKMVKTIETIDPHFFQDQHDVEDTQKKRRASNRQSSHWLNQYTEVNGYKIGEGSDLGQITAMGIALSEAPNRKGGKKTGSRQEIIDIIKRLLQDGISDIDELIRIMDFIGALGNKVPLTLLNKVFDKLEGFIDMSFQEAPSLSDFIVMFQMIESIVSPKLGNTVINEMKPPIMSVSPSKTETETEIGSDTEAELESEVETELESDVELGSEAPQAPVEGGPLISPNALNRQPSKPSSGMPDELPEETALKVAPIDALAMIDLDESRSRIQTRLMEWAETNKDLFLEQISKTIALFFEQRMTATLDPLTQSLERLGQHLDPSVD